MSARPVAVSSFNPLPDGAIPVVGAFGAAVYGAVWRLAQANDGERCVAPVELIGRTIGLCGTTARRKVAECDRAGLLRREGNGIAVAQHLLNPNDPDLAELIRIDRANGFGRCVACGEPATQMDHRIPRSRGGSNDPSNLQPMCTGCNFDKGARTMEEWTGRA